MKENKMKYRNNKLGSTYRKVGEAIDCNNDRNNDLTVIYTRNEGLFLRLRLFLIKLLMPSEVFVRIYVEFNQKFTEEK